MQLFLLLPVTFHLSFKTEFDYTMKAMLLLAIFVTAYVAGYSQITFVNQSSKKFTHLYVLEYGEPVQTEARDVCAFIKNKNTLKKPLDSSKSITLKLDPAKYYNIICLDTTPYPPNYSSMTFLYHVSGKTKRVAIENKNVETDFGLHCLFGL